MALPISSSEAFLRKRIYFWVVVAVLFTTVFSWFRLNSLCLIALGACRLWDGRIIRPVKAAFTDSLFLGYFAFFLVETAGLLHTHNVAAGLDVVSKDATLVAMAFILCGGVFADETSYSRLMSAYCLILFAASVYCLGYALLEYRLHGDSSVFFYHPLTRPILQNAVFYSVYVLFGLLFLLSPDSAPFPGYLPVRWRAGFRLGFVLFFLLMIVLLSSKLLLAIALFMVSEFLYRRYLFRGKKRVLIGLGAAIVLLLTIVAATNNPIKRRYQDLLAGDIEIIHRPMFHPSIYFNALQLRLLEFRFAGEIVSEQRSWLFGVTPGDSQDLLDQKYVSYNMYVGDPKEGPHRHIRGFIGYNFHNQYLETFVRDGIVGLVSLLAIFFLLLRQAIRRRPTKVIFLTILTIAIFFIPEAPLTMQHGVFLFCFFPLLSLYSRVSPQKKTLT